MRGFSGVKSALLAQRAKIPTEALSRADFRKLVSDLKVPSLESLPAVGKLSAMSAMFDSINTNAADGVISTMEMY